MVGPTGMSTPKLVLVKLHPMPKTRSASWRKVWTGFGIASPPEPRARGWFSGNALLPWRLVVTGAASCSARRFRAGQAFA